MKTGWPSHLLQDDSRKLSDWFASRVDARWAVRQVCAEIERNRMSEKQPEALSLAAILEMHPIGAGDREAAALLRTQHADIERKDALLRQALEASARVRANMLANAPELAGKVWGNLDQSMDAIRKELQ